jgi:hypothetical protein
MLCWAGVNPIELIKSFINLVFSLFIVGRLHHKKWGWPQCFDPLASPLHVCVYGHSAALHGIVQIHFWLRRCLAILISLG